MSTIHNHLLPLKQWTAEDSNVLTKIKLQRENAVPTISHIRQNLGPRLADAVFSNVDQEIREVVGLDKELVGGGDQLWTAPARQILGEIILEPYPTRRHKQALTHQSILDYGEKCMEEWQARVESQKAEEMAQRLKEIEEKMKIKHESQMEQVRAKEREDFLHRLAMMEKRLSSRYQCELAALEKKMTEEKEAEIADIMERLNDSHKEDTDALLTASNKLLTNRFHFKLNWLKSDLEEDYNNKLRSQVKLMEMKTGQTRENKEEEDEDEQRRNVKKLVCTVCLTADLLLQQFREKINSLKVNLRDLIECNHDLAENIKTLEDNYRLFAAEKSVWECVARDLAEDFQKFIEYQLKTPKEELTFLINWDKIVEKKDRLLQKMKGKWDVKTELLKEETREDSTISEKIISLSDEMCRSLNAFCDKDVLSILSGIIKRVIPSISSNYGEAQVTVNSLIEEIINNVIPSSVTLLQDIQGHDNSLNTSQDLVKTYCPKMLRTERNVNESSRSIDTVQKRRELTDVVISKENSVDRITVITRAIEKYPDIMPFK